MADFEAIHERAKFEPISEAEIAQIVRVLEHPEQGADPYMLIQTLGRAGAAEHVELVERYLLSADDPMVARAALETLCQAGACTIAMSRSSGRSSPASTGTTDGRD